MKRWIFWGLAFLVLATGGAFAVPKARAYWQERNRPKFLTSKVTRDSIVWEVKTTGTIQPVVKVSIGTFVSGPIIETHIDFNDKVEKGDLLAKIDPRIYAAAVRRDEAALATAKAEVLRVKANLQQAKNDERRSMQLKAMNADYVSDTEMDQFRFARMALEAQALIASESVNQAQGRLDDSNANLAYTVIKAPTSGIVIDKKIDEGMTLAAQFQMPELFVIAPEMDKRMWVHATVLEPDIGVVRQAKEKDLPVHFSVDAYPDELFEGRIHQVRQNPTTDQNVVTYPVIVETSNPGMKLLPGMTANLSFEIERKTDVLCVPGGAIRYLPDVKLVRTEDKKLIDGNMNSSEANSTPSASDRVAASQRRRRRHVWVKDGDHLKAIQITFGLNNGKLYELVEGDLTEGQELVTGTE